MPWDVWRSMPWEAWATLGTVALLALAMARSWASPDTVLLGGMTLLMTLGLFSDEKLLPSAADAARGLGNVGLVTIGVLFVIAEGLRQTGAMSMIAKPLLGRPKNVPQAQMRLMLPVAGLSAFLNNTPIVAMYMPVVNDWCRKSGISPSKLFLPLSYAAILGGKCTLIGTSTNIVVLGLIQDRQKLGGLDGVEIGMFTLAWVGIPTVLVGIAFILIASPKLLTDRKKATTEGQEARRYSVDMIVEPGSAVAGKSIEQADLRQLPGAYLAEIERGGERIVAVGPEQILHAGDRLIFVGVVESVVDLQKIRGLAPATDQVFKLNEPRPDRCLIEAVVSDGCPIVGKTIREGRFRSLYDAVVIAVHRGNEHLNQKIGDIELQPGDTLLMEAHPRFVNRQRNRRDFYLVSAIADSTPIRHNRAWIAIVILLAVVGATTFTTMSLFNAAMIGAGLMALTRCVSMHEARNSVDWRVLLAIGSAFAIGEALMMSGAGDAIADTLLPIFDLGGNYGILAGIYLLALLFTVTIGNIGSAVLVFPIALKIATEQDLNFLPFTIAIMMAASASYATPIAYPTNMMVYSPGGYRFGDYIKLGVPLNALLLCVDLLLIPFFFPL